MRTLVSILFLGLQLVTLSAGQQQQVHNVALIRATWSPPCVGSADSCGSPAVTYLLQLQFQVDEHAEPSDWQTVAEDIPDTFYTFTVPFGIGTRSRVAGVDSLDRAGVWSDPSQWIIADYGAPGMPLDFRWGD